jgi:hypothetical protein
MAGVEKVFLLSSPHPDAASWHRNAIDAARRTQVQLLVRSSILGADRESPAEWSIPATSPRWPASPSPSPGTPVPTTTSPGRRHGEIAHTLPAT